MRTNEEEEDYQSKTMGSDIEGVLKMNSGDLVDRSHTELPLNELIAEWRLRNITVVQLVNRISEANYRYSDVEFLILIPIAEEIIKTFKRKEDGFGAKDDITQLNHSINLIENINFHMMNACEELAEVLLENRSYFIQLPNPIDAVSKAIDFYTIILDKK